MTTAEDELPRHAFCRECGMPWQLHDEYRGGGHGCPDKPGSSLDELLHERPHREADDG